MTDTAPSTVVVRDRLDADEGRQLDGLFARVAAVDGSPGIDRTALIDLAEGGRDGLSALVVRGGDGEPTGYAQAARVGDHWQIEVAVDPAAQVGGDPTGTDLGRAVAAHLAGLGGGPAQLWLEQPRPADLALAGAIGLSPARRLYQVRRPLPVEDALQGPPLPTRAFRPGEDEAAWVEVNNRAFSWHPEQGGWDLADVAAREAEPWFDAEGFRLHETDGHLDGFCWTKVHTDVEPAQGEIYVIAVDPDAGGRGLGRGLVLAGLAHLAGRGITVGMLYVDAANVGAVKLYADLGFEVDHVNVLFTGTVSR